MKVIVMSAQKSIENEIDWVIALFEEGMNTFHLRKPHYSIKKLKSYLDKIPSEFHSRIVLHSHHKLATKYNVKGIHLSSKDKKQSVKLWWKIRRIKRKNPWITLSTSYHSISDIDKYEDNYNYVFLSPIFDSISNQDFQSGFKEFSLSGALRRSKYKVVALGGIDLNRVQSVYSMGFWGCAFLGSIWTAENPVDAFIELREKAKSFKYADSVGGIDED